MSRLCITFSWMVLPLVCGLVGCASMDQRTSETMGSVTRPQLAHSIARLQLDHLKARAHQIDLIAPHEMQVTAASLREAKHLYANKAPATKIAAAISKASSNLDLARAAYSNCSPDVQEILVARAAAVSAGALRSTKYSEELRQLDNVLKGSLTNPDEGRRLVAEYHLVEVGAVQETRLGSMQTYLKNARQVSASSSPALSRAERAIELAQAAIVLHPRSSLTYDRFVREARHATLTLAAMGSKNLDTMKGQE